MWKLFWSCLDNSWQVEECESSFKSKKTVGPVLGKLKKMIACKLHYIIAPFKLFDRRFKCWRKMVAAEMKNRTEKKNWACIIQNKTQQLSLVLCFNFWVCKEMKWYCFPLNFLCSHPSHQWFQTFIDNFLI